MRRVPVVDDPADVCCGAVDCAAVAVVVIVADGVGDVALVVVCGPVVAGTGAKGGTVEVCAAVVDVIVGASSTAAGPMRGVAEFPNANPTSDPDGG